MSQSTTDEATIAELLATSEAQFAATVLAHDVLSNMDPDAREDLLSGILQDEVEEDESWNEDDSEVEREDDDVDLEFVNTERFYDLITHQDVDQREDLMRTVLERIGDDEVRELLALD